MCCRLIRPKWPTDNCNLKGIHHRATSERCRPQHLRPLRSHQMTLQQTGPLPPSLEAASLIEMAQEKGYAAVVAARKRLKGRRRPLECVQVVAVDLELPGRQGQWRRPLLAQQPAPLAPAHVQHNINPPPSRDRLRTLSIFYVLTRVSSYASSVRQHRTFATIHGQLESKSRSHIVESCR